MLYLWVVCVCLVGVCFVVGFVCAMHAMIVQQIEDAINDNAIAREDAVMRQQCYCNW
jgi:hypothetical protein